MSSTPRGSSRDSLLEMAISQGYTPLEFSILEQVLTSRLGRTSLGMSASELEDPVHEALSRLLNQDTNDLPTPAHSASGNTRPSPDGTERADLSVEQTTHIKSLKFNLISSQATTQTLRDSLLSAEAEILSHESTSLHQTATIQSLEQDLAELEGLYTESENSRAEYELKNRVLEVEVQGVKAEMEAVVDGCEALLGLRRHDDELGIERGERGNGDEGRMEDGYTLAGVESQEGVRGGEDEFKWHSDSDGESIAVKDRASECIKEVLEGCELLGGHGNQLEEMVGRVQELKLGPGSSRRS